MDSPGPDVSNLSHADPFANVLLVLAVIIIAAMLGRRLAKARGQAPVVGELLAGVVIGNVGCWLGNPFAALVMHLDRVGDLVRATGLHGMTMAEAAGQVFGEVERAPGGIVGEFVVQQMSGPHADIYLTMGFSLWVFSNLGIILLLFMTGLENSVGGMVKVGKAALAVGLVGVIVPIVLGYGLAVVVLPDASSAAQLFIGTTLCATSVGITARVLRDLNVSDSPEARVVLSAAVIDDILGLIVLAVVVDLAAYGTFSAPNVVRLLVVSGIFLAGVVFVGSRVMRAFAVAGGRIEPHSARLLVCLCVACLTAWLADLVGLASIVGAFAAGLALQEDHFRDLPGDGRTLQEVLAPLESVFVPVFFVLMGMQVNLATFLDLSTLLLAFGLTVAAVVGKLCVGLVAGKTVNRLVVGIGMVPRGEVGLIFAGIGKGLGVLNGGAFSAVIIMVILTTFLAPIGLKWAMNGPQPQT